MYTTILHYLVATDDKHQLTLKGLCFNYRHNYFVQLTTCSIKTTKVSSALDVVYNIYRCELSI